MEGAWQGGGGLPGLQGGSTAGRAGPGYYSVAIHVRVGKNIHFQWAHNKLAQTRWLTKAEIHSLSVV